MLLGDDVQRVFHECCHHGLQASLLRPSHFLFCGPCPFLLEGPLYDVCALHRVRRWRVEESTIAENQFDISSKFLHRRVFARTEVLHHRAKVHRVLDLIKVTVSRVALGKTITWSKKKRYVGQPSCIGSTGLENIAASGIFSKFFSTSRALTLLIGVSGAAEGLVGAGGGTSFSLPLVDGWRLSAGGLTSGFAAGSGTVIVGLFILIDPGSFPGDATRASFSVERGCGLLLGFLLGEANARISSSSSSSSNRSFFLFPGATASGPAVI